VSSHTLCVLGLGYIGLPTASMFATHGLPVVGVDVNQRVVDILRNGQVHVQEPGLRDLVEAAFASGNLRVASEPSASDAFILAVPTPILPDKRADLQYVVGAAESIIPVLAQGNLVVLESTSPPRTTVDVLIPILERSGLKAGQDFHLCYSPERVLPGQILRELVENARVIGGIDAASAEAGRELYRVFVKGEIHLTDATTAEMVKLMENTFRDVNIGLANEFGQLADRFGVDIWQAVALANLHPRVQILQPGPGVGGHCIGVDPWFLVEAAPNDSRLIRQARLLNDEQPAYCLQLIERALGGLDGRRIAALGLAYKADVDDLRESPSVALASMLAERRAQVTTYEPYALGRTAPGCQAAEDLTRALAGADAVVLLVGHRAFLELDPKRVGEQMPGRMAIDLRGVWSRQAWRDAGFDLWVLGGGARQAGD
jgi:UDP-N-acetyl-D-mannosaminuronic acid dehydrogenase